jgi:hypothetical protein
MEDSITSAGTAALVTWLASSASACPVVHAEDNKKTEAIEALTRCAVELLIRDMV